MSVENEVSLPEEELPENWREIMEAYCRQVDFEVQEEISVSDPVAQECDYHRFVSESNGRNRRRRKPRLVELLEYHGKIYTLKGDNAYGKIDEIAADVLRDIVDPDIAVKTLLTRVRGLKKLK